MKSPIDYIFNRYGIIIALLVLVLTIALIGQYQVIQGRWQYNYFMTKNNLAIILQQVSINGILAIGMTYVIITGGVDLSVGSVLALSGIIAARFVTNNDSYALFSAPYMFLVPAFVAVGVGMFCGAVNGFIISKFSLQPFIVTLGMLSAARGMTLLTTHGNPISALERTFRKNITGDFLGIPVLILIFLSTLIIAWFVLNKTIFGRYVYATGGNEKSARTSGINTRLVKIWVYSISGALAGLAGLMLIARTGAADTNAGLAYELDAIAAVVIGGTSMSGGRGRMLGTFFGILIIGVMSNGLDTLGIQSYWQQIIKGSLIVGAVMLDSSRKSYG